MAKFEVYIPPATDDEVGMTFRVTADNWMAALKTGLLKMGGKPSKNILCDIQDDNSIHVTDPASGKVFRIVELPEAAAAPAPAPAAPAPAPAAPAPAPAARAAAYADMPLDRTVPGVPAFDAARTNPDQAPIKPSDLPEAAGRTDKFSASAVKSAAAQAAKAEKAEKERAEKEKAEREKAEKEKARAEKAKPAAASASAGVPQDALQTMPTVPRQAPLPAASVSTTSPGPVAAARAAEAAAPAPEPAHHRKHVERPKPSSWAESVEEVKGGPSTPLPAARPIGRGKPQEPSVEDVLAELFERSQEVYTHDTRYGALYYLLDLAMEKIPADAGAVFIADLNRQDLRFAAARGPAADKVMALNIAVSVGQGIVGFCAQEGVAVAISDAHKDPRFYRSISDKTGYETRSVLCTPIMDSGRLLGCVQVINKKNSSSFNANEMSVLDFVAHQAAEYLKSQGV